MQREGASKARMPEMNAQRLCKDAKPTKHTQTLTLRKARGIVRFWKGWCGARDSADVKAYKCIQMIALRKADGIVRVREGW